MLYYSYSILYLVFFWFIIFDILSFVRRTWAPREADHLRRVPRLLLAALEAASERRRLSRHRLLHRTTDGRQQDLVPHQHRALRRPGHADHRDGRGQPVHLQGVRREQGRPRSIQRALRSRTMQGSIRWMSFLQWSLSNFLISVKP